MGASTERDAEYRLLKAIEARKEPAGWYAIRHVDVAAYEDSQAALQSLVKQGLVEDVDGSHERYRLAEAGLAFVKAYEEDLERATSALSRGELSRDEAYETVLRVGRGRFRPAQPVLEVCLASPDCHLQGAALRVLVGQWGLVDERLRTVAQHLLDHAPDSGCRIAGASLLSHLGVLTGQKDERILRALARIVRSEKVDGRVRQAAYFAMRNVLHPDPRDWARIGEEDIANLLDVDWNLVDTYTVTA